MTDTNRTPGEVPGTALAVQRMTPDQWAMTKEQSVALEAAGKGTQILPKGIHNRYQVAAILQKGHELGFAPMYSLEMVTLIEGKPVVLSQALLGLIQSRLGRRAVIALERTDERCTLRFQDPTDPDMPTLDVTWTIDDARRAGLVKEKSGWARYPRAMLYWRALAEGARVYFADVVAGLYLPDELDLPYRVDSAGNLVIDHDTVPGPPSTQPPAAEEVAEARFFEASPVRAPTERSVEGETELDDEEDIHAAANSRLELLQTLQFRLEQLSEARGQGEKWLSLVKLATGKLGYQGNSPTRLNDEELAGVITWAEKALGITPAEDAPEVGSDMEEQPAEAIGAAEEAFASW